jgi:hypothetical protein
MGGHPYWYTVSYEADVATAIDKLRQREFQAGRYNPATPFPTFPIDANSPSPGAQHASIEEAMDASDADGTRSILDIFQVSPTPADGTQPLFCTAFPLGDDNLLRMFGTTRPSGKMAETSKEFWEGVHRGSAVYVVLYQDDQPHEIFVAGYSFD